jgi:aminopeptidase
MKEKNMPDPRMKKLAEVLVHYCIGVKAGEWVVIQSNVLGEPLVLEVIEQVLLAGGNPSPMLGSERFTETIMRLGNMEQVQFASPFEKIASSQADALIMIGATDNTRSLANIDSEKLRMQQVGFAQIMQTFMQRSGSGELRWNGTRFPCAAYAQEAEMSLHEYEDFVYSAMFVDREDPVKLWQEVDKRQAELVSWLKGKKEMVVRGPKVDLKLNIDERVFINCSGSKNMPDGEIFTGPVENSVNGWVEFTYPAIRSGRAVEGVRLEFKDGKVVNASASKNEDYLLATLNIDEGAKYLGEFAFGTNYGITRFTRSILFDEKIGGTIHMALGAGYTESRSKNVSGIHWDMICDMHNDSEVLVDGELFYKNGDFKI